MLASMDGFLQRLSTPAVAIPSLLLLIFSVYNRLANVSNIPRGVPWIGKDTSKMFAGIRASIAGFTNVGKWLEVGYDKVFLHFLQSHYALAALMRFRSMARTIFPTSCPTVFANPKSFYLAPNLLGL